MLPRVETKRMYKILQHTIQARIQALLSERYGVELAQLASFFSSIASNISLIVQTRNVEKEYAGEGNPEEELAVEEEAGGL